MVGAERKRQAVLQVRQELKVSERRACTTIRQPRATQRYRGRRRSKDAALAAELRRISAAHPRAGDSVPKGGSQRRKITDFICSLREHRDTRGDYTDKDTSFRQRQIKVFGDYAITFWLDAPGRVVMVVDVSLADK